MDNKLYLTVSRLQRAIRAAQRIGNPEVYAWSEIFRGAESLLDHERNDEDSSRQYLEVITCISDLDVPVPLRPIILTARLALGGITKEDEDD